MFTLSDARGAIANSALFARAGVDVREGRVGNVAVQEDEDGWQRYEGDVLAGDGRHRASFEYAPDLEAFTYCACTCSQIGREIWGCRHVAALMIAVCVGTPTQRRQMDGEDVIEALLEGASPRRAAAQEEPVRLYPILRRVDGRQVALGLKLGRTRAYVVRSMAELKSRAESRTLAVYGKELTFGHGEEELEGQDAALYGHIVMLAGNKEAVQGGELMLFGAALDQTMRLLIGRQVEVRGENGASARAQVVSGEIALDVELQEEARDASLRVLGGDVVLSGAGAYRFEQERIVCAFGEAFGRVKDLLTLAQACPQGARFSAEQLDAVCTKLILPAGASAVVRKGQAILSAHTPTPVSVKFYVDMAGEKRLICRTAFDYLGVELSGGAEYPHIRRDGARETQAREAALRLFPEREGEDTFAFEGSDDARFALLSEQLAGLERVGEVHVSRRLASRHVKKPKAMTFGLAQQGDKLVLRADLGGYTQEELEQALCAYREKRAYVRLSSGVFLSGEALEQAAEAAQVLDGLDTNAQRAQAGEEMPVSRAMYLDAALKERKSISLRAPKAVSDWTQRLRDAQKTRAEQPNALKAQLRSYQLEGLSWLCALSDAGFGGILADDMGLGKTIQALALLLREKEMGRTVRALVVCPASLQLNWSHEAQRFAPDLDVRSLMGDAKAREAIIASPDAPELLITSYDQLRRDVRAYADVKLTHVLLDEAQNIKNAASQAAKAVKTLQADHRFAMTGTPIENRLSELWSLFDFLMPGYLGAYKKFRDRFEAPVVREADERARENLHLLVAPFILRRMKQDVLTDLPEKVETVMESEMTAEQMKLYAAYAQKLKQDSKGAGGQDRMKMLAGLTRLRQICCDPRLCVEGYGGGSGKLAQLGELVQDALAAGHRILLFSQFTSMLTLIEEALHACGVTTFLLTGDTDKETRMQLVEQFNAGGADVFLISLKAGGTGLNLTGADVVIHYDPWWNIAAQNQATDRAYRIGQTKGVQVIKLIASDTVEEHILRIQEQKRALAGGVLEGEENLFTVDAELLREVLGK